MAAESKALPGDNNMRSAAGAGRAAAEVTAPKAEGKGRQTLDMADVAASRPATTGGASEESKEQEKPKRPKGKPGPPFKNPMALIEPTKEMLVPGVMVIGASFLSWCAGRLGFSVLFAFIFGGAVFYSIATLRDRIMKTSAIWANRMASRKRVLSDNESVEWINTLVWRFWQYYEPELCQQIRDSVQPVLDESKPAMLSSLKIQRFTLGKNPPFISSARFILKDNHNNPIPEDKIILDLTIGLHAPDLEVVVAASTGFVTMPVCVKDVWFEGKMRVEVDLVPDFPHAKTALVCFMEKPIIDFNIVPLKSVNIMEIPGLAQWLNDTIINGINDNLVNPEKLVIDLMECEGGYVELAKGMVYLTVTDAEYTEGNSLDILSSQEVFVEAKIGTEIANTEIKAFGSGITTLSFNDAMACIVKGNLGAEKLVLTMKQRRYNSEKVLGKVYVPVTDILNSPNSTITDKLAFESGNGSINVKATFKPLPDLTDEEKALAGAGETACAEEVGMESVVGDRITRNMKSKTGTLVFKIHSAKDLVPKDSNGFSDPYVKIYYTNMLVAKTPVVNKSLAPEYDFGREMTVCDIDRVKLLFRFFDKDDYGTDEAMGDLDIDLSTVFEVDPATGEKNYSVARKWFPLRKPGRIEEDTKVTVADLKRDARGERAKTPKYGNVCLTLIFRPANVPEYSPFTEGTFHALLGNPNDDLSLSAYDGEGGVVGKAFSTVGKGVTAGFSAVGAVGVGAVSLVGKGISGAGSVAKSMNCFAQTPSGKGIRFFKKKDRSEVSMGSPKSE